ncbi:D-isomer-specific 2-hydroxyacid dehydrogenase [Neokomagataea thailandica NBRC 106555]|uniref:2-hydroxyacid dehydrogenase n=2 Tax=Neokomagataea TaxID=1223423 RepID=A0A4Y6V7N9_9PROT|nr:MULTISPECIES: 2-hydroxyacid dehydrogenase [Neokomagataea]QDH24527.1 2-hydroxyacid dehydrogenase [Neokomagataea tanensis]GBR51776.1 D-isomer-specific 2-hydroxyacid dehydrogenase [Neokomagataea thailandica NBRC 106555]
MSTLAELLLIDPFPAPIDTRLKTLFTTHQFTTPQELSTIAPRIRGVATGGGSGLPRAILDSLPNLEIISVNGVGTDQIDLNEAKKRNIRVTTTLGTLTDDVADMALSLLLATLRNTVKNDSFVRSGQWGAIQPPLARTVRGRKVGIVGFGNIGQAIAHRVSAFGVELAYFNSRQQPESPIRFEPNLFALAEWADVLILAVSGGPRSAGMINADILKALGPDGVLINIARGTVVDEDALLDALQLGTIAGAGLDVFQNEPAINPLFLTLQNTVLQAHQASATLETRSAMGNLMVDNLIAHFEGKPLLTPIL